MLLFTAYSLTFSALYIGRHFGDYFLSREFPQISLSPIPEIVVVAGSVVLCIALIATGNNPPHLNLISLLFAPFGTLLRFFLDRAFNRNIPFLGTFLANSLGTLFLACLYISPLSSSDCRYASAFSDGFCGCLTTVSTLVAELDSSKGYRY